MLRNLLNKLENPRAPLLGPTIKGLEFSGLLLPENRLSRIFRLFLHSTEILFGFSEFVEIWFARSNVESLLNNLKTTMMASVSLAKVFTMLSWQNHWKEILNYVTRADLEQRKSSDEINQKVITRITKHCRFVTYFYWLLTVVVVISIVMAAVLKYLLSPMYRENARNGEEEYVQILSSWVPFDRSTLPGYIGSCIIQTYALIFAGVWLGTYDANAVAIMVFFKGEIELLRRDSSKIFGSDDSPIGEEEVGRRLKECHLRHQEMLKYVRLLDSCLSPIMLMYVVECSIMICFTSYQIISEASLMQRGLNATYLAFQMAQLLLYCWHSNDVFHVSQDLYLGPYESLWWRQNAHRKGVLLLMIQFRKIVVFTAGPFADLNMGMFISIIKGAYSYYTILSQSNE